MSPDLRVAVVDGAGFPRLRLFREGALLRVFGVGFLIGVSIFVYDFFKIGREPLPALSAATHKAA